MNSHILNLSAYTSPEIVEQRNRDWIEYGVDNNYFQYLIDRYTGSTTNNAIINGISKMIYGKGLSALNSNKKPEEYAKMLLLFKKEDLRRFVSDRKLLGMASFQMSYDKGQVVKVSHFPMETLRPEKANDKGEIEAWYYHPNWSKKKPSDKPKRINAFGFGNKKGNEIYVLRPYVAGFYYFSPVDYQGALPYALLEEEIGDYLINDTLNGFSGTKVVNFNNGIPDAEKQKEIKNNVLKKLTGTKGEKVIVAFNNNVESKTTVEDMPLNDAPQHYEYLSTECMSKLTVGHRVTSPMLIGIRNTGGGLGNNADEIKTASLFFDNIVIKTYQEEVLEVINDILLVNDIVLKTYFKTIQPLEFIETEGLDKETKEEETGVKLSQDLPDDVGSDIADELINLGQDESELLDEYDLVDESEVDYELNDELDEVITDLNTEPEQEETTLSKIWNFVSIGTAKPNAKSTQDGKSKQDSQKGVEFLVRYSYAPEKAGLNSRQFCSKMVGAKKVYRKEDIVAMGNKRVNPSFAKGGKKGSGKYSIWLWKGGSRCNHKWFRKTYQVKNGEKSQITSGQAKSKGFKFPKNAQKVSVAPKDMKYKGYTAEYWNKMKFTN